MLRRHAALGVQLSSLAGFLMSAFLVVEYLKPTTGMACGPNGGCAATRLCWEALPLGSISLPHIGIAMFGAILFLSFSHKKEVWQYMPYLTLASAAGGLSFLAIQAFVCHSLCRYCLVTDLAGIFAGIFGYLARQQPVEHHPVARPLVGIAAIGGFVAMAGAVVTYEPPARPPREPERMAELPRVIAREQRAGVATIVEFADYECPFCRRQHEALERAVSTFGPRVRLVRKNLPLTRIHPNAENAARAACCAEEQDALERMAGALITADDLSTSGCEAIAQRLQLDMNRFRECVSSGRITDRLARERDEATQAHVNGLPTMFVGRERFSGLTEYEQLRASIERALQSTPPAATPAIPATTRPGA